MRFLLFRDLRIRWPDFLLGSLLIAIVAAALLLQRSIAASAEGRVHELAHHLGKNMLVLPAGMPLADFHEGRYGEATMPADYPARLSASPLATHIRESSALLYGTLEQNDPRFLLVGMDTWPGGIRDSAIGPRVAHDLKLRARGSLTSRGVALTVAEVTLTPPDGLDRGVFTSLPAAQEILKKPDAINALRLGGCWCSIDVETLATEVEKLLPGTQAITVAGMVRAQKGAVATTERYSTALYLGGIAIILGTIIALTAAQVRRSLPELGLLLAMGASPVAVTSLFVVKAGLIAATGAVLGLLLALALAGPVGSLLLGAPLSISLASTTPVFAVALLLSMGAALIPAWRAAGLDPTEVLRND